MSDHWEMFACTVGEHPAFITYDHGVSTALDTLPPNAARFDVTLLAPDDRGLPAGDEFAQLNSVESLLEARFGDAGQCVGRVTTDGHRYYLFYTRLDEAQCAAFARDAGVLHGHAIDVLHAPDPERAHYRDELFPTPDDWQVMQDMKTERALREAGDPLDTPRPIEHWAYFPDGAARDAFVAAVGAGFSAVEPFEAEGGDDRFGVKLSHVGLPDYHSINATTLRLARAAREVDGSYDGWETEVCRDDGA
jgi:hypothetical protein